MIDWMVSALRDDGALTVRPRRIMRKQTTRYTPNVMYKNVGEKLFEFNCMREMKSITIERATHVKDGQAKAQKLFFRFFFICRGATNEFANAVSFRNSLRI